MQIRFRPTLESMESRANPSAAFNGSNDVGVVLSGAAQESRPLGALVSETAQLGPRVLAATIRGIEVDAIPK